MLRIIVGCVVSALLLGGCQTSNNDDMLYRTAA